MRSDGWKRNLVALWIAQTMTMVAFSFVIPFFPLYVQFLGIVDTDAAERWAGAIVAITAISMTIAQPIWGNLADQRGRRPMVIRSMACAAVVVALMGMVTSVEQLLVLRFIQGAVSGTIAATNALATSSVPKSRLGFALGLMQVAYFLGSSAGPLIGGVLADTAGFRVPFYAASVLMVLSTLTVVVFVREDFVRPTDDTPRPGPLQSVRLLFGLSAGPILITIVFLIQLSATIVSPVLTLFVSELNDARDPATVAGIVLAGMGVTSAGAALWLGRLGDRIGHSRILTVCLIGAAVTCFPQALVQQVWQLLVLRMLLGFALGGLMPSANVLLANLVPRERRGAVFGITAAASSMANAVGPLSGAAIGTTLGMRAVFTATGVLYVLSYVWVLLGLVRRNVLRVIPSTKSTALRVADGVEPGGQARPADSAIDSGTSGQRV